MSAPLLAYYGDDFTGSADVMEVMQWAGLRTILFLQPPNSEQLAQFDNLRGFGVAGWSRSMSPSEMEAELRPVLSQLKDSGAEMVHYKVCSTFDSSPSVGSIGKAIEIGRETFGNRQVPIVIGAPNLGRYQVFGNLFARSGLDTEPYRLDRHPTMQQHPITPMSEADLRVHLAKQTQLQIGLLDIVRLKRFDGNVPTDSLSGDAVLIDVLHECDLSRVGRVLQVMRNDASQSFIVGSSGVEYAFTAQWTQSDRMKSLQTHAAGRPTFGPTEQLIVITGSCSPVNDRQIRWAEQNGFETIRLDPSRLIQPGLSEQEIQSAVQQTLDAAKRGANVILHSSRGPHDARVAETIASFQSLGFSDQEIRLHNGRTLGPKLGDILKRVLAERPQQRVCVAGGDTSGYVARELGITALEAIAPVAPGSPLCRAHASNALDGVEFCFKGGQVGKDDVWGTMLEGTNSHNHG